MAQADRFGHISKIIEFLRGKTIIESITVICENVRQKTEGLDFSFLDYVIWPYGDRIHDSLGHENACSGIEITARQLFEDEGKSFTIGFNQQSVYFRRTSNIEDTLLLDLKRYLESNAIPCEANANGVD